MSSRVLVPCEKGRWFCPSKSTTFDSTFPSALSGLVSASDYSASIARINASLERPKWTYRVQTAGRVLITLGVFLLLVSGGAWFHMKHHHRHHHHHHHGNGTEPLPPSRPVSEASESTSLFACSQNFEPVCGENGLTYGNACEAMRAEQEFVQGACTVSNENDDNNEEDERDERDGREMDQMNNDDNEEREDDDENKQAQVEGEESSFKKDHKNKKHHKWGKGGNKKHRKHAKRCIRRLIHSALASLVLGFLLCRWMVMKKLHLLITRVVPAVCAEHHLYTSNSRAFPISWSLDERSICRYKCKNNKLVLVLDVGVSQPLSAMALQGEKKTVDMPMPQMASSAYVPLTTKEEA